MAPILSDKGYADHISADSNGFVILSIAIRNYPQYDIDLLNMDSKLTYRLRLTGPFPDHFKSPKKVIGPDTGCVPIQFDSLRGFQLPPGMYIPSFIYKGPTGKAYASQLSGTPLKIEAGKIISLGKLEIKKIKRLSKLITIEEPDFSNSCILRRIYFQNGDFLRNTIINQPIDWRFYQ